MNAGNCKFYAGVIGFLILPLASPANLLAQTVQGAQPQQRPAQEAGQKLTSEQLQSMLAPIALYPDPLLAQVLAASTYPLQIVEAAQWLQKNKSLEGSALVQAASKKNWDPSVQALVVFPSTLGKMSQNVEWTTALGNAFLAQQPEVMGAVQELRKKAYSAKALTSNSQQKVDVENQQGQTIIKIEPADPQVVYVPSYNPTVVYGAPPVAYPYPAMVYPAPSTGAVVASSIISFGAGVALGAAFHGCCAYGWGWNTNWGAHDVTINNTFVNSAGLNSTRTVSGTTAWAHNPAYRGAVPYSSASVAGRYGNAAAVRTPYGGAGAVAGPNAAAARASGPYGTRSAVTGPSGSAQRVSTPYGSAGAFEGAGGNAAGIRTPQGSALKTPSGTYTSPGAGNRSAFSTGGGADWARSSSARGNSSLSGGGGFGGGFGGGGARGGGGFRGGGRGRR